MPASLEPQQPSDGFVYETAVFSTADIESTQFVEVVQQGSSGPGIAPASRPAEREDEEAEPPQEKLFQIHTKIRPQSGS